MAEENNNQNSFDSSTPAQQPAQPTYGQQQYGQPVAQPVYAPAPLMQLTGGMKFGWFVIGAFMGLMGILLSWLTNADKIPQVKSDALKWSVIGFVVWILLGIILSVAFAGIMTAVVSSAASYGYVH